ncbi:MAG: DUF1579 family protein [Terriglobales bacterium]
MRMALFLVILGLGLGVAWAQEKEAAKKEPAKAAKAAKKPAMPDMTAKQSPEMAKLAKMFVGTWAVDEKFEAIPEMGPESQAGTGKGTEVVRAGPAGNSLIVDFKARSTMGPFSGHGVIWWDAKAGVYRSLWCDSEGPGGCDVGATGKWEGNDLVFTANAEMPGPKGVMKMKMKQAYSEVKPASFTFYIDSSIKGGAMKRMITLKYKK